MLLKELYRLLWPKLIDVRVTSRKGDKCCCQIIIIF
jgi:hypothetical protein